MEQDYKVSLKAARTNANLNLDEAAEIVGCSKQTMINYENGRTFPTMPTLMKICEAYAVPLDCISLLPRTAIK